MTDRIEYIDVFRAFGIILMVMGHVGFGVYFDHFIHVFHMPMFFFISGFFFKSKSKEELSFWTYLKKKMRTLLVPYLFFGILHMVIYVLLYGWSTEPLEHLVWINTDKLPIAGALWFLTALFFADVIYFLLDRFIKNKYVFWAVIILLAVAGCTANRLPFTLPFGLSASLAALLLYHFGRLTKTFEKNRFLHFALNMPWYAFLGVAGITVVLSFVNGYINMRTGSYGIIPLFYVNVLLSVSVLINFAKYLFKWFGNRFPNNYLTGIGKNSIVYLSLNQAFVLLFKSATVWLSLPSGGIGVLFSKGIVLICTMAMLYLSELIFTRTRLRKLIGK